MVGIQLNAKGSPLQPEDGSIMKLKMARLKNAGVGGKIWAAFIPTGESKENGRPLGVSGNTQGEDHLACCYDVVLILVSLEQIFCGFIVVKVTNKGLEKIVAI